MIAKSDHASIAAQVISQFTNVRRTVTDWDGVRTWADHYQTSPEEWSECDETREHEAAYPDIRDLMRS